MLRVTIVGSHNHVGSLHSAYSFSQTTRCIWFYTLTDRASVQAERQFCAFNVHCKLATSRIRPSMFCHTHVQTSSSGWSLLHHVSFKSTWFSSQDLSCTDCGSPYPCPHKNCITQNDTYMHLFKIRQHGPQDQIQYYNSEFQTTIQGGSKYKYPTRQYAISLQPVV